MKQKLANLAAVAMLGLAVPVSILVGPSADDLTGTVQLSSKLGDTIPLVLGDWKGQDIELNERELDMLNPDDYLNRVYTRADGAQVVLYILYQGNKQRAMQHIFHHANICYPALDFELKAEQHATFVLSDMAKQVPTCRYIFQRGSDRRMVLTFFKVDDEILDRSPRDDKVWQITERISDLFSGGDNPGTMVQVQIVSRVERGDDFRTQEHQRAFFEDFGRVMFGAFD